MMERCLLGVIVVLVTVTGALASAQPVADHAPTDPKDEPASYDTNTVELDSDFVPLLSDEAYQQLLDSSYGSGECVSIQTINGRVYRRNVPCSNKGGSWWLPIGIVGALASPFLIWGLVILVRRRRNRVSLAAHWPDAKQTRRGVELVVQDHTVIITSDSEKRLSVEFSLSGPASVRLNSDFLDGDPCCRGPYESISVAGPCEQLVARLDADTRRAITKHEDSLAVVGEFLVYTHKWGGTVERLKAKLPSLVADLGPVADRLDSNFGVVDALVEGFNNADRAARKFECARVLLTHYPEMDACKRIVTEMMSSSDTPAELLAAAVIARGERDIAPSFGERFAEALRAAKLQPKLYIELASVLRDEDMAPSLLWIIRRGDVDTASDAAMALARIIDGPAAEAKLLGLLKTSSPDIFLAALAAIETVGGEQSHSELKTLLADDKLRLTSEGREKRVALDRALRTIKTRMSTGGQLSLGGDGGGELALDRGQGALNTPSRAERP